MYLCISELLHIFGTGPRQNDTGSRQKGNYRLNSQEAHAEVVTLYTIIFI